MICKSCGNDFHRVVGWVGYDCHECTEKFHKKMEWKSIGLYEHPAKHQAGTYGNVVLSPAGVYAMRAGTMVLTMTVNL